jgi:hypothetical protein
MAMNDEDDKPYFEFEWERTSFLDAICCSISLVVLFLGAVGVLSYLLYLTYFG